MGCECDATIVTSTAPTLLAARLPPMDAGRGSSAVIFPVPQVPALALLFPPPPPGALPSSSLSLSSSSSSSRHAPPITSFPILVLTVLGILAACVLLLAYYVFVVRCCLTWHRDRGASDAVSRRPHQRTRTRTSSSGSAPASSAEPRGLEDAAIRALPAFSYRKKSAAGAESPPSAPASECAVCLGEFEDGDRVRMLPACLHVFHVGCVDAWLQGNASCPLCRARADVDAARCCLLLPPPPAPPPEEEVVAAAIQVVVVVPGAEEDDDRQGTLPQRQREATVALAAASEVEGEDPPQVGGGKTKSAIDDSCHGMTEERRKDADVVAPRTRRSFSTDGDAVAGGGEVHLQIQSVLQRDGQSLP